MAAQWVHKLNESDSRLHKEDVLKQALELATLGNYDSQVFLSLLRVCYDGMITFGVKQVSETAELLDRENPWQDFNTLLMNLYSRILTGNAAKNAIEEMSKRFDSDEWNTVCVGVLKKDMRAGVSVKTINKVFAKHDNYRVRVFECQLATNCEGRPEMSGIKRLEPKLDGVRVLMQVRIGAQADIISFSRNGKEFENFSNIERQVLHTLLGPILDLNLGDIVFLDGEVVGNSFQDLMRQARRKKNAQADDSVFHVFDIIPYDEFVNGGWNTTQQHRIELLEALRPWIDRTDNIRLMDSITVNLDTNAGHDQLDRYAKDCVQQGYEGIMIKDLESGYKCSRNTAWLKWKPTITVDLEVIDVEEGTGRNTGSLGALVCQGQDNGLNITVNVGSGFSDADRDSLWRDRSMVIGRTVEILCDVITQNQDGTYSLRFPRFVRFRDDK